MLNVSSLQPQELTQAQIYEDLSQIIKIFKTFLSLLDIIASNFHRLQDNESAIQQLKQSVRNIQGFIKFYNFSLSNESEHKNTFHRFICRIMQVISAYKLRFQVVPYSALVSTTIKQIQRSALQYQNQKNIGQILRKIQITLIKFYSSKEKKKNRHQNASFNQQSSHNYSINSVDVTGNGFQILNLTIHKAKQMTIPSSKSDNQLNKLMVQLNKKYRLLNSLDLDFNYFKQSMFQSKDNKQDFFAQYFQRNQYIYRQIVAYSKSFSQYLKRRQQKKSLFRKNKFLEPNSNRMRQTEKESYLNFTKKKCSLESRQSFYKNNLDPLSFKVQKKNTLKNLSQIIHSDTKQIFKNQYFEDGQQIGKPQGNNLFIDKIVFTDSFHNFQLQNQMQLSKRKKNLQLKKVDISLSAHSAQAQISKLNYGKYGGRKNIQSLRRTNIFYPNLSQFKTQQIKDTKQDKQLQSQQQLDEINQLQDQNQTKINSNQNKINSIVGLRTPMTPHRRKYLIKTSSKKSSIQQSYPKKENGIINVKNFKRIKVQQIQKLENLGKDLCKVRSIKIPPKQN